MNPFHSSFIIQLIYGYENDFCYSIAMIRMKWSFKTLQTLIFTLLLILPAETSSIQQTMMQVEGVTGGSAKLQCKVTQHRQGGNPILVLWYKDGARLPFFTLDLREDGPTQFFDKDMRSRVKSDITGEWLTLHPLITSDSAQYKCQVNYENSPTLSALVNLTVYEPPTQLLIQDEAKHILSGPIYGPVHQDSSLKLFCIAIGGIPNPKVSWWSGDVLLTDINYTLGTFLSSQEEDVGAVVGFSGSSSSSNTYSLGISTGDSITTNGRVISELNIHKIGRSHAGANITCMANNNNISTSLSKTLTLNVYLRPSSVEIKSPKEPLREAKESRIKCETSGSYPPAKISWEKSHIDKPIILDSTSNVKDGKTISWLSITPKAEDHGSKLTCTAHNPNLPGRGTSKSTVLQVQFAPRVLLHLGKNLKHREIKEGEDVYFECDISSNPRPRITTWHKDGNLVEQDLKAGVLLSGENLVLQRIHRKYAGNYTCSATNDLGSTTSNIVELPIMFLPVCKSEHETLAVAEGDSVQLNCRVEARPSDDLSFIWLFNNTLDTVEVGMDRVEVEGSLSFINYTPLSPRDYGTLSCWATNDVGMQAEPCRFTVVEAGPPERVKNCVLVNHTVGALEVRCSPGSEGGSPHRFVAKVYASATHNLLVELKNQTPRFHVVGLTPGHDYHVSITAENDKGSSEPVEIDAVRLKVAEKRMGDVKAPNVSPLVGVFLGLVGGFILVLVIGLLISRARSNRFNCWRPGQSANLNTSGDCQSMEVQQSMEEEVKQKGPMHIHTLVTSSPLTKTVSPEEDEESPDLVKSSNETSQLLDSRKCPDMITRRHTYSPPIVLPTSSPIGSSSNFNLSGNRNSFLETQSPLHLPSDESFV